MTPIRPSRTPAPLPIAFALALVLAAPSPAGAEGEPRAPLISRELREEIRLILARALDSHEGLEVVRALSDEVGPRLSGSPAADAAVQLVARKAADYGLKVELEAVQVPRWTRGDQFAELVDWPGRMGDLKRDVHLLTLGGSVATPDAGLTAEVVVVDDFDHLAAMAREAIEGKIVLYSYRFDEQMALVGRAGDAYGDAVRYRWEGPSAAARKGAVASLVRSVGIDRYRLPHTGSMGYEDDAPKIPAAAVSAEDADRIVRLASRGAVRMHLRLTPKDLGEVTSYNVIADIPGTERPSEIVLVSGHLDSWDVGDGALDDAAGVAMALESLRVIRELGLEPRRTLRFVAWMNEENGMAGVKKYMEDKKETLRSHLAALEVDAGNGAPIGYRAMAPAPLIALVMELTQVTAGIGVRIMDTSTEPVGSDISRMGPEVTSTMSLIQDYRDYFRYHHTEADTFDKVEPAALRANTAALAALVYTLGEQPLDPLPWTSAAPSATTTR